MILVKAEAGLVIEFGVNEAGKWNTLSVRIPRGTFQFEVSEGAGGKLLARPSQALSLEQMTAVLAALGANEDLILAEVRKYAWRS